MTATGTPSSHPAASERPLLGLRHTPGRLALAVFRLPLWLYRRQWGWLLGRTFMMFIHVGRKTGTPHEAVAMVLGDDRQSGEVVICSGWGPSADWLLNLEAGPAHQVRIGHDQFMPEHRFLTTDEAVSVVTRFRVRHPRRVRLITSILGWGDLTDDTAVQRFVTAHPFVAFRPANA